MTVKRCNNTRTRKTSAIHQPIRTAQLHIDDASRSVHSVIANHHTVVEVSGVVDGTRHIQVQISAVGQDTGVVVVPVSVSGLKVLTLFGTKSHFSK